MASALIVIAAVVAAAISAATGMAGGVLLLAALTLAVPAVAVVPLHGAVQLVAGGSRAVLFRSHVDWRFVRSFALGLVPGSLAGTGLFVVLASLDPKWLQLALGSAILLSLWPSRQPPFAPDRPDSAPRVSSRWTSALGFACGVLGMLVGSTGPLVSRGLLAQGLVKEHHVGTKAWVQALSQLLKLPLFGLALSFDYGAHLGLVVFLAAAVVGGTLVGKRLLRRLSVRTFVVTAQVLLLAIGVHIVGSAVWSLTGGFG